MAAQIPTGQPRTLRSIAEANAQAKSFAPSAPPPQDQAKDIVDPNMGVHPRIASHNPFKTSGV